MQHQFLTTADVAERLGITTAAVSWRVRQGLIVPSAKGPGIRGAYLFNPDYVDQLVDERRGLKAS